VPDPSHRFLLQIEDSVVGQNPLDSPLVKSEVEDLAYLCANGGPRQAEFGPLIDHETDDLRGDFVGLGLTSSFADQSGEPPGTECIEGLIERFPGVAELPADPCDEALVVAVSSKHLILDLGGVPGVEEARVPEQI